ncbi:hypothetical protein GIB67_039444 [Kingdonia uniflora]|uniref:Fe2OG dioxygenase domain-containing protein n=1 Tax=Kingdonia uniflora TaxID=39325 RepID=A0A7J7LIY3_9MAGN|nr:hypothetical protein GIB67_039444 [Kingdonia uniflora]
MESGSALRLPTIDFSSLDQLKPETPEWESTKMQVRRALEEYGCFEVVHDQVFNCKEIFSAMKDLFNLPLETKILNQSKEPFTSHQQFPAMPLYESTGINDAPILEQLKKFTKLMWPRENEVFSETIHSFSKITSELDQMIRRMVLESFGVEEYYNDHINLTKYHLGLIKYNPSENENGDIGIHPHTDKNMTSILFDNQIDGLEIQTKFGEWINVKISPKSFIFLIGDSFLAWTNGRLQPPVHRVTMRGNKVRYSLVLFSVPKGGHLVQSPKELVDKDHRLLFNPFDYQEFITTYASSFKVNSSTLNCRRDLELEKYCGVKH